MHDIFAPVIVVDNSFTLFCALVALSLSILYGVYFTYKHRSKALVKDEKYYLHILENLDLSDAKRSVMVLEHYLKTLVITQEQKEKYEILVESFSSYKYMQKTPELPAEIQKQIGTLLEELRAEYV